MVNIAFFMIFAVFDPSPLTVCINCSFFTFISVTMLQTINAVLILKLISAFQ